MPAKITEQFVTEAELNSIKGLCHYLDTNLKEMGADVVLTDTNGERIGIIKMADGGEYALHFLVEDPNAA